MKGTNQRPARCIALQGQVGTQVSCSIYQKRSSTCREFGVHWHHSAMDITPEELDRCNQARIAWGLPVLKFQISRFPFVQPTSHQHHRTLVYPHLTAKSAAEGERSGDERVFNRNLLTELTRKTPKFNDPIKLGFVSGLVITSVANGSSN